MLNSYETFYNTGDIISAYTEEEVKEMGGYIGSNSNCDLYVRHKLYTEENKIKENCIRAIESHKKYGR